MGDLSDVSLWRVAEANAAVPIGARLGSEWVVHEIAGRALDLGFDRMVPLGIAYGPLGKIEMALIHSVDLEDFLKQFSHPVVPWVRRSGSSADRCWNGKFLLNDPRVGFFHNQRLSYELARLLARRLGRTLVLPGFFKFPHPQAYDGTQWVPAGRLIDWSVLGKCSEDIVDLEDLIQECGPGILDDHVTVPFVVNWMAEGAPWINGTRPHLRWRSARGGRAFRFQSRFEFPPMQNSLNNHINYYLFPFLEDGIATARTIRAHGLILAQVNAVGMDPGGSSVCFLPEPTLRDEATSLLVGSTRPSAGLHMRFYKDYKYGNSDAGSGPAMSKDMQSTCIVDQYKFAVSAATLFHLRPAFGMGDVPTSTFVASNEDNGDVMWEALGGFPRLKLLSSYYPLRAYADAVTVAECTQALRSVLLDAMVMALVDYFIGNMCSSMSQYIRSLRTEYLGLPINTSHLLGGSGHGGSEFLQRVSEIAEDFISDRMAAGNFVY